MREGKGGGEGEESSEARAGEREGETAVDLIKGNGKIEGKESG